MSMDFVLMAYKVRMGAHDINRMESLDHGRLRVRLLQNTLTQDTCHLKCLEQKNAFAISKRGLLAVQLEGKALETTSFYLYSNFNIHNVLVDRKS
jgi:hypothetical protein